MKVIPETPMASKKRGEKHNKYILATHGPLSRFAVRIGYILSQKYVKQALYPIRVKVLTHTRYPPRFDLDQGRYFAAPLTGGTPQPVLAYLKKK